MKNILLDYGLRFFYILYTINTAMLASVKNYSIKQKEKKEWLEFLTCIIIVAVVVTTVKANTLHSSL